MTHENTREELRIWSWLMDDIKDAHADNYKFGYNYLYARVVTLGKYTDCLDTKFYQGTTASTSSGNCREILVCRCHRAANTHVSEGGMGLSWS